MELVNGEPLSAILARAGRLSPDATLDIVSQAARALDAAHQAGIVHRDIKPGNLLVAAGGTTKITDFGIATAVAAAQASHLTETGMVMGTAMYVSPEQATGAQVTDASDIYSLGVVAYECLAGHPPFTASEPLAIAFAHKHEPVPALPPDVPQPVSDLVYHMLAKTPEERPASVRVVADRADVLRDALALGESADSAEYLGATRADLPPAATGALLGEEGPGSGRPRGGGSRRPSRRRQLVAGGSTAVLCAAAVATGLYLSSHSTGQTSGNAGNNTARHLNSPSVTPVPQHRQPAPPVRRLLVWWWCSRKSRPALPSATLSRRNPLNRHRPRRPHSRRARPPRRAAHRPRPARRRRHRDTVVVVSFADVRRDTRKNAGWFGTVRDMTQPRLLGGRYELDGVVGRGGMAEVYRARDIRLDRIVAIKTLRTDLARDQIFQARFRREAQSAASLNHPSIVAVYDTGEDMATGIPVPYIVMEYVDGRTVRDLLQEGHRLLPERSLEIIDGVLRALDYSHQAGIVHRDIKPGNVMVTRNGDIKVMDFGIARAMSDAQATMTQTAQVIGTAQYLSPEQARGERVDSRSDLYSTGCLLYELLTGRPPFTGDSPVAIAYQHVRENPVPPSRVDPDVPAWADAIVLKAMAKSPGGPVPDRRGHARRPAARRLRHAGRGGAADQARHVPADPADGRRARWRGLPRRSRRSTTMTTRAGAMTRTGAAEAGRAAAGSPGFSAWCWWSASSPAWPTTCSPEAARVRGAAGERRACRAGASSRSRPRTCARRSSISLRPASTRAW